VSRWTSLPVATDMILKTEEPPSGGLLAMATGRAGAKMSNVVSLLSGVFCFLLLTACHSATGSDVSNDEIVTFPETGHSVRKVFVPYYQAHGGIENLGHPIHEGSIRHGLLVQYFDKARMEYHPDNAPRYRVQLGLLGETLGRREPPLASPRVPLAYDAFHRYYPQTGHTLSQPFLAHYDSQGGLDRFGYPLSEPYRSQGVLMQDFQRARLVLGHGGMSIADWGRSYLTRPVTRPPPRPPSR
jgi:hypothetical protein